MVTSDGEAAWVSSIASREEELLDSGRIAMEIDDTTECQMNISNDVSRQHGSIDPDRNSRGLIGSEKAIESGIGQSMWVSTRNSKSQQIDNVDNSNSEIWEIFSQDLASMQDLGSSLIAAANENDIGVFTVVR